MKAYCGSSLIILGLIAATQPVLAADAGDTDGIVVTGVQQAYRGNFELREIPLSIARIDA